MSIFNLIIVFVMIAIFNMFTLILIIGVVQEKKSSTGLLLYLDFVFVTDRKLEFRKLTSWMVDDVRLPVKALNHRRQKPFVFEPPGLMGSGRSIVGPFLFLFSG